MNFFNLARIAALIATIGFCLGASPQEGRPPKAAAFQEGSVWYGTCEQDDPPMKYPVVYFVQARTKDRVVLMAWYPSLDGLIEATGTVSKQGAVSLTEGQIIRGQAGKFLSGTEFTGTAKKEKWTGTGEFLSPQTKKTVHLAIDMRLVE